MERVLLFLFCFVFIYSCQKSNSPKNTNTTTVVKDSSSVVTNTDTSKSTPYSYNNSPKWPLATTSETLAQFNHTNFGVYKGVLVGSTGIILFYINNGDSVARCYLTIDNMKDTLTTTQTFTLGQPIVNAQFTGRISSVTFNTDQYGNASISNLMIEGHSRLDAYIMHEESTSQIYCYEGTLTGGATTGTFNFIRLGLAPTADTVFAIAKIFKDSSIYKGAFLTLNDSSSADLQYMQIFDTLQKPSFTTTLSLTKDTLQGTWSSGLYGTGNFTSVRTY
jgi:hypothetical protein